MTYDLAELKRLLAEHVNGTWYVAGPQDGVWQVVCCETDNNEDDYALFECTEPNAALIVAAVNSLSGLIERVETAEYLIRVLIENDPDELIADGGHTVLDEWRYRAREFLETKP